MWLSCASNMNTTVIRQHDFSLGGLQSNRGNSAGSQEPRQRRYTKMCCGRWLAGKEGLLATQRGQLEMSAGTFLEPSIVLSVTLNLVPLPHGCCSHGAENCDTPLIDPCSASPPVCPQCLWLLELDHHTSALLLAKSKALKLSPCVFRDWLTRESSLSGYLKSPSGPFSFLWATLVFSCSS